MPKVVEVVSYRVQILLNGLNTSSACERKIKVNISCEQYCARSTKKEKALRKYRYVTLTDQR